MPLPLLTRPCPQDLVYRAYKLVNDTTSQNQGDLTMRFPSYIDRQSVAGDLSALTGNSWPTNLEPDGCSLGYNTPPEASDSTQAVFWNDVDGNSGRNSGDTIGGGSANADHQLLCVHRDVIRSARGRTYQCADLSTCTSKRVKPRQVPHPYMQSHLAMPSYPVLKYLRLDTR